LGRRLTSNPREPFPDGRTKRFEKERVTEARFVDKPENEDREGRSNRHRTTLDVRP
jgi:hypothetical protein